MSTRPACRPTSSRDDDGATLLELLVGTTIMSLVLALVTGGLIQMLRVSSGAEDRAGAQSAVGTALLRIDKQIRYASGLGQQYVLDGTTRIEYEVVETGRKMCQQLRLAGNHQIQQRHWVSGAAPIRPTAWATLAHGVTAVSFVRVDATDQRSYQQLTVTVAAGDTRQRTSTVTFTALNTDVDTATRNPTPCVEGKALP